MSFTPVFQRIRREDPENRGLLVLTSLLGMVMDHILFKTISKQAKVNKVIRNSQNAFPKGKLYLTNITALCDGGTGAVNKRREGGGCRVF